MEKHNCSNSENNFVYSQNHEKTWNFNLVKTILDKLKMALHKFVDKLEKNYYLGETQILQ